jgi:uncharacterized cofD-like protein
MKKRKKIVVIGGGTGTFTVLSGLKRYPFDLTAIVTMSDDGGSTGALRDELGVLPPGDVRQCLVALSTSDKLMRELMSYRFTAGGLKGHSFGNLLLSALEKMTGSFDGAVEKAGEILRIEGRVVPVTLNEVTLVARVGRRIVRGESNLDNTVLNDALKKIYLEPRAQANPKALRAIRQADAIVIGPGNFYSSLVPNLLVRGISKAIRESNAQKVYVCNLVAKAEHNQGFTVGSFTAAIEAYLGSSVDKVIYNTGIPAKAVLKRYLRRGESLVTIDADLPKAKFSGLDLVSKQFVTVPKSDVIKRALIRHDPAKLAKAIAKLVA